MYRELVICVVAAAAAAAAARASAPPIFALARTIRDTKALNYAVESRIYPEEPGSMYVTLRGGGISKYGLADPAHPVLVGHLDSFGAGLNANRSATIGSCEGQDRVGDLLVITTLGDLNRSGIVLLNVSATSPWPPNAPLGRLLLSLPGALHLKLWRQPATHRLYAIITLGLTHVTTRSGVVAVDVTDPTAPVEAAHIETDCECTEGVAIIPSAQAALIGSYCSSTAQLVSLDGLPGTLTAGASHTEPYYENLVSGTYNSSYRLYQLASATAPATLKLPRTPPQAPIPASELLFSATYADPGGLVIFNLSSVLPSGRDGGGGGGGGETVGLTAPRFPAELSKMIRTDTARANRVHLHPSGVAFLALEKGHGDDSRGGIAAVDVRDPLVPTLLEVVRTPDNSSRTYCVASAPAPARAGESDVVYAFGATSATMWVYVFHQIWRI